MVEISILDKSTDKFAIDKDKKIYKLKLLIKGETPTFLNVLRRIIQEEVKTLAIEDVYIIDNNSAMWDEMLAHRLGLIVLNTPENLKEDSQVKFYLEKNQKGYIYASDLKSENPEVYPVYPETMIGYLDENQKVKLEAVAILGNGKIHSKFMPGHVYYYRTADIKLERDLDEKEIENLETLGVKVKKGKIVLPEKKEYDRTFIDAIESAASGKIKIIPKDEFVFIIESYGQYSAEKMLELGLNELERKLRDILNFLMNN
ncbi:DNA-directed RNA polymerase subunit D [Nanoarchaeota archaeon]